MTFLILFFLFLLIGGGSLYLFQRQSKSTRRLERNLKDLSDKLRSTFERLEETKANLETTFAGMVEGVLIANQGGDILYTNPAFRKMFGLEGAIEGRSVLEALASVACDDAIKGVVRNNKPVRIEVSFERPKKQIFQAHFSPISREGKTLGVVAVFHDLTEIRRLEEIRRDFIANLSHELKTPLTAIRGFSETLLEEAEHLPESAKKSLEIIMRNAAELNHLVENLLNLSRIESGKEEIVLEQVSLKPFVDGLLERFQTQAKARQVKLHNEIPENILPLRTDAGKLNQILGNLVDNAVKYSSAGGDIWVRAYGNKEGYSIEVEDTGPGIPLEDQTRIFERFYRVDKARSRDSSGGAGLGLSIVKHLVELQGGRVSLESIPGQGSKFMVFLRNAQEGEKVNAHS